MDNVIRVFVEKKESFDLESQRILKSIKSDLGVESLKRVRVINRYDMEYMESETLEKVISGVLSEKNVDTVYTKDPLTHLDDTAFAIEYLPGQYDQRADSAAQCIQLISKGKKPEVKFAKVILLSGAVSDYDVKRIKEYMINPVDSREASLEKTESLKASAKAPKDVEVLEGFKDMDAFKLQELKKDMGIAMDVDDLIICRDYFKERKGKNPSVAEIKVLDTYWSDHCRHTTFLTEIKSVEVEKGLYSTAIEKSYKDYLDSRKAVYEKQENKPVCLMDVAVMAMKEMRSDGRLEDLELSEEINACSIEVEVDVDGVFEKWLVMFKNETHNHPTEIEPFGGAATCLGGAIRDPLSGRAYVYQAMRVTGSGDPRVPIGKTISGKLPQRKITTEAASGFSSYGNQIGLATGKVEEAYDPGFIAKRMEIGAVIAAAPLENVKRKSPESGDVILLIGGKTGRDGCGGATGSSKKHTLQSVSISAAEVQKGNAPEERKIQRLFRNPELAKMIKKCNDFGAGGVSVAIGELSDSIDIYLDKIPKKYEGLDGTELAISESQERMAVVVDRNDVYEFQKLSSEENLSAMPVADVTATGRLRMKWRDRWIFDIERDFLDRSGARKEASVKIASPGEKSYFELEKDWSQSLKEIWLENLKDLNIADKKGLVELFDSTVGASSVLMPYGGLYEDTPTEGMAAKIPIQYGETNTATIMAHGYNPSIGKWSPFHGGLYAALESIAKVVAIGGDHTKIRLSLQEYFEKLETDPLKWGKPLASLLGAFQVQKRLSIPAIGGKDSMSGTFEDLTVPPTLVSFALAPSDARDIISPELKSTESKIVMVKIPLDREYIPDYSKIDKAYKSINELIKSKVVLSAHTVGHGGAAASLSKMAFGNRIGVALSKEMEIKELFYPYYSSILLEVAFDADLETLKGTETKEIGKTKREADISFKDEKISLSEMLSAWREPLSELFPFKEQTKAPVKSRLYEKKSKRAPYNIKNSKPKVFIPSFPGTNSEYDTARAFRDAGGDAEIFVFKNLEASDIERSIEKMAERIDQSQIIAIPGGFSAGDEPEGSGKFIAAVFKSYQIKESVMNLLNKRDGLVLGICNGFQALIKLGLLPYGEIKDLKETSPTLTFNSIGRHVARMGRTKIVSNLSPWLSTEELGAVHNIAISHGEGRFVADEDTIERLIENGQVATQYADLSGNVNSDERFNPNGSMYAIEGITSPDGRVFGKMGHSERYGKNTFKNIVGNKEQKIFEAGIRYFK